MKFLIGATNCVILCAGITAAQAQNSPSTNAFPDYKGQKFEIVGANGPSTAPLSISSASAFTTLTNVALYPVLYCGGAGGGPDEYPINAGPSAEHWLLEVPSPPDGAKIYDVRYEPYDNIIGMNSFASMLVEKVDDRHIAVAARAYPFCAGARVRLKITVSYAK